jgi:hypothetical protein
MSHAIHGNNAATVGPAVLADGLAPDLDPWDELFERAADMRRANDGEMVPYWVFHQGPAKIERHVPVLPFSRDTAALPRLRKALAAYRLAFGRLGKRSWSSSWEPTAQMPSCCSSHHASASTCRRTAFRSAPSA